MYNIFIIYIINMYNNNNNNLLGTIITITLIAFFIYYIFVYLTPNEYFDNKTRKFCKNRNDSIAYTPTICSTGKGINRKYDFYKNCKCVNEKNECTICYPKPKIASLF